MNCKRKQLNWRSFWVAQYERWHSVDIDLRHSEHAFVRLNKANETQESAAGFHILSLDGGGLKGLYAAAVLANLESDTGPRVAEHFDLITGTSTGGLIALAIGAGVRPKEVVEFYTKSGPQIFRGRLSRSLRKLVRSKYDASALRDALQGVFGEKTLGDSIRPLVIPSYDIDRGNVYLFKTPHHDRLRRDWRVPMWEVAMATAAAPTYFPVSRLEKDRTRLIDGGVWANNPTMAGIVEAVSIFGKQLGGIRVLSLGTTSAVSVRKKRLDRGGLLQWGQGGVVLDVLLKGQSIGAVVKAQHLLGEDRVVRLDPVVPKGFVSLDSADSDSLISMAAGDSRVLGPRYQRHFASHNAFDYRPIYSTAPSDD